MTGADDRLRLLVTLVHGTWGRGFFPKTRSRTSAPFWFESDSHFCKRLSAELSSRNISHGLDPFLWSGANSVFERDETAHALARHLIADHLANPYATQMIVAHSHGGNIALRALHYLTTDHTCHSSSGEKVNPLVVTMATPFIELHPADLGYRPLLIRLALVFAASVFLANVASLFLSILDFARSDYYGITMTVISLTPIAAGILWIKQRGAARENKVCNLKDSTKLDTNSAHRLLAVRAVDDEASLILALGTICNRAITIAVAFGCIFFLVLLSAISLFISNPLKVSYTDFVGIVVLVLFSLLFLCFPLVTCGLMGGLMLSRSVHGRELATAPMECQINTQSAPDGESVSRILTLISHRKGKTLRHGIYEHEECAKAIADWTRAQLDAERARTPFA